MECTLPLCLVRKKAATVIFILAICTLAKTFNTISSLIFRGTIALEDLFFVNSTPEKDLSIHASSIASPPP